VSLSDPETDFFLNAAHLQLHRRSRALARLAKLADTFADAAASEQGGKQPTQPVSSPAEQAQKPGKRKRNASQQQKEEQPVVQPSPPTSLRALLDVAVPLIQVREWMREGDCCYSLYIQCGTCHHPHWQVHLR
jgi:hypothetical protein